MNERTRHIRDTAGVIAPPPLLCGGALILSLLLNTFVPLSLASCRPVFLWLTGASLIAVGLVISTAVVRTFRKIGTPVSPWRSTTGIVQVGPYRYSRNPDYVGQMLIYFGAAVAADTWWPFLLVPVLAVAIQCGVVRREERYLEDKFGQEYRDYKAQVPRWL